MKSLVFDTGSLISMNLNDILWILDPLKRKFKGSFFVTKAAHHELVERPLKIKRFEFEALRTLTYFKKNVLSTIDNKEIADLTKQLLFLANHSYMAGGEYLKIVHDADMEGLAATIVLGAEAYVVDERTARWIVEKPSLLDDHLAKRMREKVKTDKNNLKEFQKLAGKVRFLRSIELVYIAYKLGILDIYKPDMPEAEKKLLESVLWGMKLKGCAITRDEIEEIINLET